MKKLFKKLSSSRGETLIETLCAVFIISAACAVFAGMTIASTRMNDVALSADLKLYTELSAAEKHEGSTDAKVIVSWIDGISVSQTFSVSQTGIPGQLVSYVWTGS